MTIHKIPSKQHGGKRLGAGRKAKYGEPTVIVRVPESAKPVVVDFLTALADRKERTLKWPDDLTPVKLLDSPHPYKVPFFGHSVKAGFPSPADDYIADTLDLNDYLMPRKEASFMLRVDGDSMLGAGIHSGDMLVVDRSITASNGSVVVAAVDGQFTVKRLEKLKGVIRLLAENPSYQPIEFKDEQELRIFGVVTSVIHQFKP